MQRLLRFFRYVLFVVGFYALIVCAFINSQAFVVKENANAMLFDTSALLDKKGLFAFLAIVLSIANCLLTFLIKIKYEWTTRRQGILSAVARASTFILTYFILKSGLDSLAGTSKNVERYAYVFIVICGWFFILIVSIAFLGLRKTAKASGCFPEYVPSASSSSYSSMDDVTATGTDVSSSGKNILNRFSKNAYIERDAVRYEIYVNCFYDNKGLLRSVDNTASYKSVLAQFSKENEKRFYGTESNTFVGLGGKIVDIDGDWRYLNQGEGFYDSRRHYCVVRGNYL